jgi:putative DNA primase/helicase
MDLRGLRFALMEETPEEGRLDTHKLKTTVGATYITARRMRRYTVTFKCSHTLWINTNFRPMVDTTDHATWRRLKAMLWAYRFFTLQPGESLPPQEPDGPLFKVGDPTLRPSIEEHPDVPAAVIAYLVEGAYEWYQNHRQAPVDPEAIKKNTSEWRETADASYRFAKTYLTTAPGYFITGQVMKDTLLQALVEDGKSPWSTQLINTRLRPAMLAVGVTVDRDPTVTTTIKADNIESRPDFVMGLWKEPGKTCRVWRGVRFKTVEERVRDGIKDDPEELATAPGADTA